MSKTKVKLKVDKNALRELAREAFDEYVSNEGVGYECPECGAELRVAIGENVCPSCGFVINAVKGELES